MSLSSHLDAKASPIGEYLRAQFVHTKDLTSKANAQLRATRSIQPLTTASEHYPYGTIGEAIDYRIRYSFALTPSRATVAYLGAQLIADNLPSYSLTRLGPTGSEDLRKALEAFFDAVDTEMARLDPVRHVLSHEAECQMARLCITLSLFEEVFRCAVPSEALVAVVRKWVGYRGGRPPTELDDFVNDLLAIAKPSWVEDICRMSDLFIEREQHLLHQSYVLNPTFSGSGDVGGADADLIVGGCLIDIKSGKQAAIEPRELRQLAGYALLDYEDELHINSVGLYKARYGVLFTWPVEEFLAVMVHDSPNSLSEMRGRFQSICRQNA